MLCQLGLARTHLHTVLTVRTGCYPDIEVNWSDFGLWPLLHYKILNLNFLSLLPAPTPHSVVLHYECILVSIRETTCESIRPAKPTAVVGLFSNLSKSAWTHRDVLCPCISTLASWSVSGADFPVYVQKQDVQVTYKREIPSSCLSFSIASFRHSQREHVTCSKCDVAIRRITVPFISVLFQTLQLISI